MQEVLLSKNSKRGSMLVPVSNLLVCRLLRRKKGMKLIRNNCSFPFETLFIQLQIASLNSCSSHSFLPLPIFFQRTVYTSCVHFTTTYTYYTVTSTTTLQLSFSSKDRQWHKVLKSSIFLIFISQSLSSAWHYRLYSKLKTFSFLHFPALYTCHWRLFSGSSKHQTYSWEKTEITQSSILFTFLFTLHNYT